MPDIIFTPIIHSGTDPKLLQFKVRCSDVVLLEDIKKMFVDMLMKKDFSLDVKTGLNEKNNYSGGD